MKGISFEIYETPSEGLIPVLILPSNHSILKLNTLSVDVGELYFMVIATDAWAFFETNISKESNFIIHREDPEGRVEMLSLSIEEDLLLLIQEKGGVLVVENLFDAPAYESGSLNAFLLGAWAQRPF